MIAYILFRFLIFFTGSIPFTILYFLSDLLSFLLYRIFKYRREVVRSNLTIAFPYLSKEEIIKIEKQYYTHLADLILEGIKSLSLSDAEIKKRYHVLNPDFVNLPFETNKSSLFLGSHFNNWEYGIRGSSLQVKAPVVIFFKPIKNKKINEFIRNLSAKSKTLLAPISETKQSFESQMEQNSLFIMVADQSPSNLKEAIEIDFFQKKTKALHGPAKYAHQYFDQVFYFKTIKVKRGFYQVSAHLLSDQIQVESQQNLTQKYFTEIEKMIQEQPANWLWSHKRWKNENI